jgi:hypothetical protein
MASSAPDWLMGQWISDPADQAALQRYGSVALEFRPDGSLVYSVFERGRTQQTVLSYRVEGGMIVTNQASNPEEEQTAFAQLPDGKLRLTFGGASSTYVRAS